MNAATRVPIAGVVPTSTPVDSELVRNLLAGRFALTAEVTPPADGSARSMVREAESLSGAVDAINVTDGASARVHMSSLAASILLQHAGHEPVLQLTCRDRNRIALQAELLGAGAAGLHHVLLLTGDAPSAGDEPDAKPVFDLSSTELVEIAAGLRDQGTLASGRPVLHPPHLFIGVADSPVRPTAGWRPDGLLKKAEAGAQFAQTQFCFDVSLVRNYMQGLREAGITARIFMLIGVGVLRSARSARWMRENLGGVSIPDSVVTRLEQARDPEAEGIRIAVELLQAFAEIPEVAGAHLMAPGNLDRIPEVVGQAGLRPTR